MAYENPLGFPTKTTCRVKVINPLQVPPTAEAWIAWTYADTTGPFGNHVEMWKDEQPTFLGKNLVTTQTR